MSERDSVPEQPAGALQRIAHVAKEEEFGRRYAIGVRGNPAFANINSSVRKELTQVIIGPAIAEPELENDPGNRAGEFDGTIERGALR